MTAARMVLASRNDHKLGELNEILDGFDLVPLPPDVELPPEDGATFSDNALIKARAARAATGLPAIADDSGICADALGGRPGVRSARFAGEAATDEANVAKLIEDVFEAGEGTGAHYVCVIAYIDEAGRELTFEGRCDGQLIREPRGTGGFGYDPAFVPDEQDVAPGDEPRTMAELPVEEKHAISHRGRAGRLLASHLGGVVPG